VQQAAVEEHGRAARPAHEKDAWNQTEVVDERVEPVVERQFVERYTSTFRPYERVKVT
jgi:hypothetical protein